MQSTRVYFLTIFSIRRLQFKQCITNRSNTRQQVVYSCKVILQRLFTLSFNKVLCHLFNVTTNKAKNITHDYPQMLKYLAFGNNKISKAFLFITMFKRSGNFYVRTLIKSRKEIVQRRVAAFADALKPCDE